MTWTIDLATEAAAAEVTRLHRRTARVGFRHIFPAEAPPPAYQEDLARWHFWLGPDRERGRRAYTVRSRGRIIGVVLSGPDPDDAAVGHLARLYVDPASWGRGVGTALYDAAIADLCSRGFPTATLWVLEDNVRARRWYERLGWTETGRRKATYEPGGIYDAQYLRHLMPQA